MISTPTRPTTERGRLRVRLAGDATKLGVEHLPFEIRAVRDDRPAMSVARGTLGEAVDIAPGRYLVTALAPDGQVLMTPSAVNVHSEQTAEAQLEEVAPGGTSPQLAGTEVIASPPQASSVLAERVRQLVSQQGPSWLFMALTTLGVFGARLFLRQVRHRIDLEWLQKILTSLIERISLFDSLQQMVASVVNPSGPKASTAAISWDTFSPASPKPEKRSATRNYRLGPITVIFVKTEGRCVSVEDDQNNHLVAAVPCEEGNYTVVACFRDAEGFDNKPSLRIEFYFPDLETNALFRYMSRADFPEAGSMSSAILASYDRANNRTVKIPSKLATLFACYVLLRQNDLEPLRGFTEQLAKLWPQSPDAVAIRIETCARLGLHAEAANLCGSVPSLGIPVVASGIAYIQQRMRQYIELATPQDGEERSEELSIPPVLATNLKLALKIIAPVAASLDAKMLVTAARVPGPYQLN